MKKLITFGFVIAIVFTVFAPTIYAKVKYIFLKVPDEMTAYVSGGTIDQPGLQVLKFIDKNATCYVATTKVNSNLVNSSISCVPGANVSQ